jgi:GntR family transcriptional regulator
MNIKKSDLRGNAPIYLQVADHIQHGIATGELAPGEQLPTVRQLAHDLRINFNTVARAYAQLDAAGIISAEQGRGTFVRERPNDRAHSQLRADRLGALVGHAIVEAFSLGYRPAEIRAAVENSIRYLEKDE